MILIRPDSSAGTGLTADGPHEPAALALDGRTVDMPSAANTSHEDPNMLVAHLSGRF